MKCIFRFAAFRARQSPSRRQSASSRFPQLVLSGSPARLSAMRGSAFVVGGIVLGACGASDDASSPSLLDAGRDAVVDVVDTGTDGPDAGAPDDAALTDAGPDSADASACTLTKPYSSSVPACNACAEQHCCEAVNACYADLECDDGYVNCALACALLPDDAGDAGIADCLSDCALKYPTGKQEYDAAIGCADTSCAVECG